MISRDDVRGWALALPEAEEQSHHGFPSFRVGGKIFCTIHLDHPRAMVKLSSEDQHNWTEGRPDAVEAVPGGWGRKGATFVWLERADAEMMITLLRLAWSRIAPRRLLTAPPS
jgi:hypothetical protein